MSVHGSDTCFNTLLLFVTEQLLQAVATPTQTSSSSMHVATTWPHTLEHDRFCTRPSRPAWCAPRSEPWSCNMLYYPPCL